MGATQMRHAKLWFAGAAGNWPLAAYEMDELREGFDDAIRLHPRHKGAAIAELLPSMTAPALEAIDKAIADKDASAFPVAYALLTDSCNTCDQASQFGFNVVIRPQVNAFANQEFRP